MSKLDREEQDILDAFDAGELQRAADIEDRKVRHQHYAESMFKKDACINIRLSSKDLRGLQKRHYQEGSHTKHLLPASFISMSMGACVRSGCQ